MRAIGDNFGDNFGVDIFWRAGIFLSRCAWWHFSGAPCRVFTACFQILCCCCCWYA